MCGLVGLVQRYDAEARVDPAPLARARDLLLAAESAVDLLAVARDLEPISLSLVGWAGLRTLGEDAAARSLVAEVAAALTAAADTADERLADPALAESTEAAEQLAQAVLAARDVAW